MKLKEKRGANPKKKKKEYNPDRLAYHSVPDALCILSLAAYMTVQGQQHRCLLSDYSAAPIRPC